MLNARTLSRRAHMLCSQRPCTRDKSVRGARPDAPEHNPVGEPLVRLCAVLELQTLEDTNSRHPPEKEE